MNFPGILDFTTAQTPCAIHLSQRDDCAVEARIVLPGFIQSLFKDACFIESASGNTTHVLKRVPVSIARREVSSDGTDELVGLIGIAEVQTSSLPEPADLVTVRFYVTNLPFTRIFNNQFSATIDGYSISFTPHSEGAISHIGEVQKVPFGQMHDLKETLQSVCWAFTLATGWLSSITRYEVSFNGQIVLTELISVTTSLKTYLPIVLFHMSKPAEIKAYLEWVAPRISQASVNYPMSNLINIGLLAKQTTYLENQALLMANFLEVIRYHHASKICVPNGHMTVRGDHFYWTPQSGKSGRATFEDILIHFCNSHHLTGWSSDFKDLRNEIVHTGKLNGSFSDGQRRYFNLHHFCDQVLLALLDWDRTAGTYLPFNERVHPDPNTYGNNWITFVR